MLTPFFPLWRSQLAAWGPRLAEHLAVLRVATLAQLEERFADCLPELLFAKADKALNSRDRIYTPWRTFWCFLCQCLNPHTSCREAVRQVQALYTSELPLFHQLMQHLSRGDIVLGDRGFGNYVIVCLLQSLGIDFLGRSARKVDARRRLQVTLVTTLLDAALYPAEQILRAYLRRWRLEMCLDDLKTTLGMEMLRCQSPAMVQKEALLYRRAHLIRFPELYTTGRGEPVLARSARLCITRRRRNLCRRNNWPRRGHRQAHLTPRGSCQEL